ncbi:MAG TPA: hypothetical protein VE776_09285 [Actinomycetota bacterium]|jgi:hypothetical protein|nr:hypothetical protein [Actinomycetota bacterium]
MLSIQSQPSAAARRGARARAATVVGAALALLIGLAALALRIPARPERASPALAVSSDPGSPAPVPPAEPGSPRPAASSPTGSSTRSDVAARLREILRIREAAFGRRDMRLLETVYAADCPCLLSGRAAIARLLADRAVWRGRAVAVEVSSLQRVTERMWIAVALFSSGPFRIEREDGALVRAVPAERQRYRLVLVRPAPTGQWLLGDASLLQGGAP